MTWQGCTRQQWAPHLPWQVFLRMLWELYGAEIEEEAASRDGCLTWG